MTSALSTRHSKSFEILRHQIYLRGQFVLFAMLEKIFRNASSKWGIKATNKKFSYIKLSSAIKITFTQWPNNEGEKEDESTSNKNDQERCWRRQADATIPLRHHSSGQSQMEAVDAVLVVLFTIECVLESGRRARRKSKVVSKNHTSQNSMGSYHKYLSWRIAALLQYFTSTN